MSEPTLRILDQSLEYALWGFVIFFVVEIFFIALRLRKRRKGLADYYREEFEEPYEREITGEDAPEQLTHYLLLSNRLGMAIQALWGAAIFAVICFLFVCFTPISIFENFANPGSRGWAPLRITSLNYDRFYEGFSLQGEVWNQSPEPIGGLRAVILIWDSNQALLDKISVPIDGDPLPTLSSGTFAVQYTKHSPFLYGYQVSFESSDGQQMSHVEGFDAD